MRRQRATIIEPEKGPASPLVDLEYKVRHTDDEGIVLAYRTEQLDGWGKRTYQVVLSNGDLQPWYLFPDEVLSEREAA